MTWTLRAEESNEAIPHQPKARKMSDNASKKVKCLLTVKISQNVENNLFTIIQNRYKDGIQTKKAGIEHALDLTARIYSSGVQDRVEQLLQTR